MEIIRKEYKYPSSTGVADIFARSWAPADGEIKAVFQLIHGMTEYGERYEEMGKAFCEAGYVFIVNDHIGHGKSVGDKPVYGYFGADKNKVGYSLFKWLYGIVRRTSYSASDGCKCSWYPVVDILQNNIQVQKEELHFYGAGEQFF